MPLKPNRSVRLILARAALSVVLLGTAAPAAVSGQISSSTLELARQNPELVRQQLLSSGMSQAEIRAQLAAAGLPPGTFDALMSDDPNALTSIDANTAAGLEALGLVTETPDGVEFVPLIEGMMETPEPDSIEGFPVFGAEVFSRGSSLFQPLTYGPVSEEYRMGPGDEMVLVLTGDVAAAHELAVTRGGFVVIPDVGQIAVTNLTWSGFRTVLRDRLAAVYSGIERGTLDFDVAVTSLRTIQVHVAGEVRQPGAFMISSVATVMNALYAAGGVTHLAGFRDVRVRRRSGEEISVDLYPYLLTGNNRADVGLEQGDIVFVGLRGRAVQLHGAVVRPAAYELTPDEDLTEVLRAAGGFSPLAQRQRITIHRVVRPNQRQPGLGDRTVLDVALPATDEPDGGSVIGGAAVPYVGLQDGDSIVVDSVLALEDGYNVRITGMVVAPGMFPWVEGTTLRDLMLLARGPTVGADLREAEVSRLPDNRAAGELADLQRVPMDSSYLSQRDPDGRFVGPPGLEFDPPGTAADFILQPYDHVAILPQPDFSMPQTVMITGEVQVPGEYTLRTKADRVSNLVDRAGGILSTGYPDGARLYRSQDNLGRIDLNLPTAIINPGSADNVTLQPGDSLHIPVYSPTVVVGGAVNSAHTVLYQAGEDFDYYISNAGGYRHDADKARISVRYANGQAETRSKFLFWSSYPVPGPGSVITVPAKDPEDRIDTRGLIADLVAITGSVATMIVLITRN